MNTTHPANNPMSSTPISNPVITRGYGETRMRYVALITALELVLVLTVALVVTALVHA